MIEYDKGNPPMCDGPGDLDGQIYYNAWAIVMLNLNDQTLRKVNATFISVLQNKLETRPRPTKVACSGAPFPCGEEGRT